MELLKEIEIMNRILLTYFKTFLAIVLLTGCTASWHVRKAQRLDPTLFTTTYDTILDTVYVRTTRTDTIFKYSTDTVEFWKDSVRIKYAYSYRDSAVYLEVECPDEKIIERIVKVTEVVEVKATFKEQIKSGLVTATVAICTVALLLLLIRFFVKR